MDKQEMTNEENYHFDVTGYLIVPGVLTPDQLKTCNEALDQLETADGAVLIVRVLLLRSRLPTRSSCANAVFGGDLRRKFSARPVTASD